MSKPKLDDFRPLLEGEETLLAGLSSGESVSIGGYDVPSADAGEARQVRGEFLRYLLLGGCKELKACGAHVHQKGVQTEGALITGVLNLQGCRVPCDIALFRCRFAAVPEFHSAEIDSLFLNESILPGLRADGLEAKRVVFFRGAEITGELRLHGAKLGGEFDCSDATLTDLRLNRAQVEGAFFLRGKARFTGLLDLRGAQFGEINDDAGCWPAAGDLLLNRCRYGAITGGPVTAAERIKWLSLQDESRWGDDFWPQPWEQCAKVLREMGHREDARLVLIEKEKRQRADRRKNKGFLAAFWLAIWDFLLAITVRYGHRPLLAFLWLISFWLVGVGVFTMAAQNHALKPNDVRIIRAAEWVACAPEYERDKALNQPEPRNHTGSSQLECFLAQDEAASYPKFNALVYSADTLLPVVAMEMQSYWIPDDSDRGVGMWARRFLWLQIMAGWALSLLAVAGFSGLIKSD